MASSKAFTDLSLPTSKGTTMEGKTTTPRRGSNGSCRRDSFLVGFKLIAVDTGFTSTRRFPRTVTAARSRKDFRSNEKATLIRLHKYFKHPRFFNRSNPIYINHTQLRNHQVYSFRYLLATQTVNGNLRTIKTGFFQKLLFDTGCSRRKQHIIGLGITQPAVLFR